MYLHFDPAMKEGQIPFSERFFWTELCWLQGKKTPTQSMVGAGCWGLSVLRGTLKLPKAFSRLVPFCQKCLRSQRALRVSCGKYSEEIPPERTRRADKKRQEQHLAPWFGEERECSLSWQPGIAGARQDSQVLKVLSFFYRGQFLCCSK